MQKSSRSGFSLVQLSLVIVIVGVLIAGLLVGRSLMDSAQVQAMVKQMQQIALATENFQEKYNAIPGDTTKIEPRGNGNRRVQSQGSLIGARFDYEVANFWVHLTQTRALLAPGVYSNQVVGTLKPGKAGTGANIPDAPMSTVKGAGIIATYNNGDLDEFQISSAYLFGRFTENDGTNLGFANIGDAFVPADVLAVDRKLDDGKPRSGMMVASSQSGNCYSGGNYNTASKTADCSFAIAASAVAGSIDGNEYTASSSTSSSSNGGDNNSSGGTSSSTSSGTVCDPDEELCGSTCCNDAYGCAPDGQSCSTCLKSHTQCGSACCSQGCAPDGVSCFTCDILTEDMCGSTCCDKSLGCSIMGNTCGCPYNNVSDCPLGCPPGYPGCVPQPATGFNILTCQCTYSVDSSGGGSSSSSGGNLCPDNTERDVNKDCGGGLWRNTGGCCECGLNESACEGDGGTASTSSCTCTCVSPRSRNSGSNCECEASNERYYSGANACKDPPECDSCQSETNAGECTPETDSDAHKACLCSESGASSADCTEDETWNASECRCDPNNDGDCGDWPCGECETGTGDYPNCSCASDCTGTQTCNGGVCQDTTCTNTCGDCQTGPGEYPGCGCEPMQCDYGCSNNTCNEPPCEVTGTCDPCNGDPCCGDPCCGDPCCGDACCGDPCCGDACCGDPCCGDSCCGDPCCGDSCCGDMCCGDPCCFGMYC